MGLTVATNVTAFAANRSLARATVATERSLGRLATGYRITRASDDASGLAISEGLRAQIGGMTQAVRNAQDGTSVVQTAEGALGETTSILQRMRDLAVEAGNNGAPDADGRTYLQKEMGQLKRQLSTIADTTSWNGTRLLDGTFTRSFQVGAAAGDTIAVGIGSPGHALDAAGLGVDSIDVTQPVGATGAGSPIPAIDAAIALVSRTRAELGAVENRFEHTVDRLSVSLVNTTAAESRIRDTDMAQETAGYARSQVLTQSGTAMLAQATHAPEAILKLLT